MTEPLTPTDEQLATWQRYLNYWGMDWDEKEAYSESTGYCGDNSDRFPVYYNEEHDQYLRGMIAELLAYRAADPRHQEKRKAAAGLIPIGDGTYLVPGVYRSAVTGTYGRGDGVNRFMRDDQGDVK